MTNRRFLQLYNLADELYSRARVASRGAGNLARAGNLPVSRQLAAHGNRMAVLADHVTKRLEASC